MRSASTHSAADAGTGARDDVPESSYCRRPATDDQTRGHEQALHNPEIIEFARWFADWWLRRGRELTDGQRDGG